MEPARRSVPAGALVRAGLAIGVLDMAAALTMWSVLRGVAPIRIPQSIASGLLGADAFNGGLATAALGVLLHFAVAFSAAGAYLFAAARWSDLAARPFVFGPAFGVLWYAFMYHVVMPLSRVRPSPFRFVNFAANVAIHVVCVGLPVALVARSAFRDRAAERHAP